MASATLIPVEEYLRTCYRPDRDYIDGVLVERNVGEEYHSYSQGRFIIFIGSHLQEWNIEVYPQQRVQVAPTRFRIPDICIVKGRRSNEQIFQTPPFLCIEILSKHDTVDTIQDRIDDYLKFGVAFVWVVNPRTKRGWVYTHGRVEEAPDGVMRAEHIEVPLKAVLG